MSKRGHGEKCTYCKRRLESVGSLSRVAATRDHVVPKSRGGREKVWACRQCNELKRDMLPNDWRAFMECYPEWWNNPMFKRYGVPEKRRRAWGRGPSNQKPQDGTYSDTKYILEHGKKAWRARIEAGMEIPTVVPLAYPNDPKAQAAYEAVYRDRLYMLRGQGSR